MKTIVISKQKLFMLEINKTKICNISIHYLPINGGQEIYIDNLNKILVHDNFETSILQRYTRLKMPEDKKVHFTLRIPKYLFFDRLIQNASWFIFNISLYLSKKILKKQDILICHYPFHYQPISWHKKIIIVSHGVLWSKDSKTLFDYYHKKVSMNLKDETGVFIVANDTNFLREIGYNIEPKTKFFSEVFKNVWFIPNCVDVNIFTRQKEILKEKLILIPRNIRYDRGIHLAIEAFNIFAKNNIDYKMMIVGSGSGKYYEYCKTLVSKYNLADKVIFAGHADQSEMIKYYNRSQITLIPSIEKEGTSLSALESMSCGTSTIVTSIGGLLDLPAIQTSLNIDNISDTLNYVAQHSTEISTKQQIEVQKNFNTTLWKKAWLNVINKINH